ncbi:MAG: hypothetical protein AAF830_16070 [Pseudomonadota bacterium]
MDWNWGFPPFGVFGFVIAIVFIGSLFNYLQARSRNETIRQLAASGKDVSPELMRGLTSEADDNGRGLLTAGVIVLASAAALALFGDQIGRVTGDDEVGPVLRTVAIFPAFIGGALLLSGIIGALGRKKRSGDEG